MKSTKKQCIQVRPSHANAEIIDSMAIKLTQTRALLLIGSDVDFSTYHSSVQQDYFGATLEYVEELNGLIPELFDEVV